MVGHDEFIELLGAYALDAIDADERRSIEAHLDGCAVCQSEVHEHLEVAAALATTIASPMPTELWGRIASRLDEGPVDEHGEPLRLPRLAVLDDRAPRAGAPADDGTRDLGAGAGGPAGTIDLDQVRRSRRPGRVAAGLVAAAAVIALFVLGIGLVNANRRANEANDLAASRGSVLARPAVEVAAERALQDPSNTTYELTSESSNARATAVVTPNGDGFLLPEGMAPLPADRTYQLWVVGDAGPVSLGVMGNEPGVTAFHVQGQAPLLAITNETAGGVTSPQSKPLLAGTA